MALNWEPQSEMQNNFLASTAEFVCYGGAAGTYKTESLLVDAVVEYEKPTFNGILFRSSYPELQGKIIPRSRELFSQLGGTYNSTNRFWHWPWGAKMQFAYLSRDEEVYQHQSAEYSWIGFDESTHRTEFQIRYLLSRLRSTDPFIFRRARCATNPGGPGHDFHQHVWLGGVCPHCEPSRRQPGVVYKDATWLSDRKPIEMTTQFIFGKWDPKGLLPDYDRQLKMQQGGIAKALLEGCWRSFEGQYFDIWEANRADAPMVVRRQSIGEQFWWPYWIGIDYGFSGSAAAAYLFTRGPAEPRWPRGRIYCIQEYVNHREDVRSFARSIYELYVKKKDGDQQPRRIQAMYLSPDCWNDRGDNNTLADQMDEELQQHQLSFERAHNDRAGGAQLIYTMLQSGELVIADTCPRIIRSLESRVHDKKEPLKVQKVVGDELDDCYDGFRYGVYSYEQNAAKAPAQMRFEQRLKELYEKDPTTAMMQADMIRRQEMGSDSGQMYTGNARRLAQDIERSRKGRF